MATLKNRKLCNDTEFKWEEFTAANNNDLLKNIGNLVNRAIKFCHTKMGGIIPHYTVLEEHQANVNVLLTTYLSHLEAMRLRLGLSTALQISALGNKLLRTINSAATSLLRNLNFVQTSSVQL